MLPPLNDEAPTGQTSEPQSPAKPHARPPRGASWSVRVTWALGSWSNMVARFAWLVVLGALALAVAAGFHVRNNLEVNTDTTDMLAEDLPFRQDDIRYKKLFPQVQRVIVIVIDGRTQDMAEDAAQLLHSGLVANKARFDSIFYPAGMEFFRKNGLMYRTPDRLRTMSRRLAEAQPLIGALSRDPSLRGFLGVLTAAADNMSAGGLGNPEALAGMFDRVSEVMEKVAQGEEAQLSWTALMSGAEETESDRRRLIVVKPKLDYARIAPAAETMRFIRQRAEEMGLTEEYGVTVRLTGSAALSAEELQSVADGAGIAGIVSLIAVLFLLIVAFRSFWMVASVLVTLLIGLVWTAAFATLAVGAFNVISIAFAVLFIGLGVDFGIHYGLRYREDIVKGMTTRGALREAARSVGGGLAVSALAAALAFLSFVPTDYQGVSELGIIAGGGMLIAFFTSMTVLPALLALWPMNRRQAAQILPTQPAPDSVSVRGEHFVQRHGWAVCIIGSVLFVASLLVLPGMEFDRNPLNLRDPGKESVQTAFELIDDQRTGIDAIKILADDRAEVPNLVERLNALPEVDRTFTVFDMIPASQQEKLEIIDEMSLLLLPILAGNDQIDPPNAAERIAALRNLREALRRAMYEGRAPGLQPNFRRLSQAIDTFLATAASREVSVVQLEQALLAGFPGRMRALEEALQAEEITLEKLPEAVREREIAENGVIKITVHPRADTMNSEALRKFVQAVRSVAPHATGAPVLQVLSGDTVIRAFATATLLAAVAITLLLLVLFRRVIDVLLVLMPLVLAGCLTIALAVFFGLTLNFANIIVLPLLLGLGVASGVHLVMRARREHSQEFLATSTPKAVLFSALTTVASFGSLAISPHRGTASMGELLLIAISMTLLCALVVLPAMMAVLVRPDKL